MSNVTTQPGTPRPATSLDGLVPYRQQINLGLLIVGVAFLAIPIGLLVAHKLDGALGPIYRPVFFWGILLAVINVTLGLIGIGFRTEGELGESDKLRLQLLAVGGLVGLCTALLGFALPFTTFYEPWSRGQDGWREHPRAIVLPALALIGGLALMFVSLQLGRGLERKNQTIRRLIYGYNAVLMALLLLIVLALPNVLAYAEPFTRFFGRPYDWAKDGFHTVDPRLVNYLAEMREPVHVRLIADPNDPSTRDMQMLLDSVRSLSNKVTWELLSYTERANAATINELMRRYGFSEAGMLVTVGDRDKGQAKFVPSSELTRETGGMGMMGGGDSKSEFLGQNALFNAMTSLTEGQQVVYFTQNHGEPEMSPAMPELGMRPPQARPGDSIAQLTSRLSAGSNVKCQPLKLDRTTTKVPDDATCLVIVRPTRQFTAGEAKVIGDYLERPEEKDKEGKVTRAPGRLLLLLEPNLQRDGTRAVLARTGLEALLARYNVAVGDNRVIALAERDPLQLVAVANPGSTNPIARAFSGPEVGQQLFRFRNVRTVEPVAAKGPGPSVDRVLLALPQLGLIPLSGDTLGVNPGTYRDELAEKPDKIAELVSRRAPCVAVAVSDSTRPPGMPDDPAHRGVGRNTPRLVVFGSASWVSDEQIRPDRASIQVDLFKSSLTWLQGGSGLGISIQPKSRGEYRLNISKDQGNRVKWLPLGLMLLAVVSLGTGVWVVRRR